MAGVTSRLEDLCKEFSRAKHGVHAFPIGDLSEDIAVLSERLSRTREIHRQQLLAILRGECEIGTHLMALISYEPKIYKMRGEERTALKKRLHAFGTERRKLTNSHERHAAEIQDRMFQTLRQFRTLSGSKR